VSSARRVSAVLLVSFCALLTFAASASAREVLLGADGARGIPSNLYVLDPSNGSVIQNLGPIGFAVTGLAEDPNTGTLYGSTGRRGMGGAPNPSSLITIDKTTGAGTLVGDLRPDDEAAADITFTPDGALFGWLEDTSDDLVIIDKLTGAASIVGDSGLDTYGSGLASDSAGTLFFAGEGEAGPLRTVNPATGATAQISTLNGNATTAYSISALAFSGAGTLFGVRLNFDLDARPTELITINTATGAITSLGPSVDRLDAIEFVNVQSTRTVTFDATKAKKKGKTSGKIPLLKVKKGKKARFSGQVSAPEDVAGCQANQTLDLQRKKPKATTFTTFEQVQTDATGAFTTKERIKKTFEWRAVLAENQNCDDATSISEKVKAKKKKKKKK
jgi:hypothetical protein